MIQFVIKDGYGTSKLVKDGVIGSYAYLAREVRTIGAKLPMTVWRHDTITGLQTYDGPRTRKLSVAIVESRS